MRPGAGIALIPGLLFAALAPFLWHGSRWAMIAAFVVSVAGAVAFIGDAGPSDWWIGPPFPMVFGILTAVAIVADTKTARIGQRSSPFAESYAAVALLGGFIAVILLPKLIANFASTAVQVYLPALGVIFAILSIFIWRGRRWAMIAAFVVALLLALLMADHVVTQRRWWGVWFPAVFGLLAVAALATRSRSVNGSGQGGNVAAEIYAAIVYLYSLVAVFLAPSVNLGAAGPRGGVVYLLLSGLIFGVLSVFIWHGRTWAMIAAFLLSLLLWLALASFHPAFWSDVAYWAAPVAFAVLTLLAIATAGRPTAAIG
jgi:hypothetical protein